MRYAITGSIGTGKSTIAQMFRKHGLMVYDADKMVHDLYQDESVLKKVEELFPEAFLSGKMDNHVVGDVIFHNQNKKQALEDLVHPLVRKKILELDNCLVDVPLLYESKMDDIFDKVIVVYCNKEEQIKRLMKRDNITKEDAINRINNQMDIELKKERGDFVVINEGTELNINKQVDDIINNL